MEVKPISFKNLGAIASFQVHQNQKPFQMEEMKTYYKQDKIEATRKSYAELVQSYNNIRREINPTKFVNEQTNSIDITNGVYYHLGLVNGKPLNGTLLTGGGFNSNFSPMIWDNPNSNVVTQEQREALKIHRSYSQVERQEANELVAVFMSLSRLAEGKKSVDSMNNDAMFMQHFPKFAKGIGLDLGQPFTINGKSFTYLQGTLQMTDTED
ncbi:hypothetical protein I6G82_12440 [Lysinibacillus macroides]|uniref:Uncharacterized protein n=1 Tax=Lysinibacillus macroides TaxID=33935 RepID=A0A0M9DJR3_9BACI|nr:hypothetical protein [Lysinibacillus macroides]KOY82838.1 hypothetical protein ADM90_05820 [Lysinibacillus macroides]QPR66112.1 hypothetical protein I6G82_12440 [Lysinibacillus macroides]